MDIARDLAALDIFSMRYGESSRRAASRSACYYVLNPLHPQGGPKARVFAAVLGITTSDWQYLRRQLLAGVRTAPAVLRGRTRWGDLYDVALDVTGTAGRVHRVRTGWIIQPGEGHPHLVTAYVDLP